jgi:hypothetical protein
LIPLLPRPCQRTIVIVKRFIETMVLARLFEDSFTIDGGSARRFQNLGGFVW